LINGSSITPARPRRHERLAHVLLAILFMLGAQRLTAQAPWSAVGPAVGDARSFAAVPGHPDHIYMGSTDGWLYESLDSGVSWRRLSKLDTSDDLIVDHILMDPTDPSHLYVGAWTLGHPDGGVWISHDAGRSWKGSEGMRGQSIRAMVLAPTDPRVLYAGTMVGVFRSSDAGGSWTLISPPGSREIHEVESLAVDPRDPLIVYAGTWHLPWKTFDGGKTWNSIKQGLIDDSDVFSIIIDPVTPDTVFLSACSGMYKSDDAAALFHKIQGVPSSARRTRVLKQDPMNRDIVYAGTTEGLYKTVDGGRTFKRMTGPDVIVNDVFVDPSDTQHVLLATDRSGVLSSRDGGFTFVPANLGFSGRKVEALLVDRNHPEQLYAGVVNDKMYGGVFASSDGGAAWRQIAEGLDGLDVFVLAQAPDGSVLAGTNHGIFMLKPGTANAPGTHWMPSNTIQNFHIKAITVLRKQKKVRVETRVKDKPGKIEGWIHALDLSGHAWLASTSTGLYTSRDHGATWQGGPVMDAAGYISVAVHGEIMAAAQRDSLVLSADDGQTWNLIPLPDGITRIDRAAFSADGTLWLGGREGVNLTRNLGKTWLWIERLPFRDVNDLYYDAAEGRVLVSSRSSDLIYAIDPQKLDWKWTRTGWKVLLIRSAAGRLLAASLYNGVLVEPRTMATTAGQR
jgi:photosystem II stability/assembly factor-like uncharacterized protein